MTCGPVRNLLTTKSSTARPSSVAEQRTMYSESAAYGLCLPGRQCLLRGGPSEFRAEGRLGSSATCFWGNFSGEYRSARLRRADFDAARRLRPDLLHTIWPELNRGIPPRGSFPELGLAEESAWPGDCDPRNSTSHRAKISFPGAGTHNRSTSSNCAEGGSGANVARLRRLEVR